MHILEILKPRATPPIDNNNFRQWFAGSVVTHNGRPLRVYHGTDAAFSQFQINHFDDDTEPGIFFTSHKRKGSRYGQRMIAAYLRVHNPYSVTLNQWANAQGLSPGDARDHGFDGYQIKGLEGNTWIIFDPQNIWPIADSHSQINMNESASPSLDLNKLFREYAWSEFLNNADQNESELNDYIDDYEDETGNEILRPRGRELERNIELSDPNFFQYVHNKVTEDAAGLAAEFTALIQPNQTIRGWRAIEVPPSWRPTKNPGYFGKHWTRTQQEAQAIFGIGHPGHVIVTLEADIPLASIDWLTTVRANLSREFSTEDEITLKNRARVNLIKVIPQQQQPINPNNMAAEHSAPQSGVAPRA